MTGTITKIKESTSADAEDHMKEFLLQAELNGLIEEVRTPPYFDIATQEWVITAKFHK